MANATANLALKLTAQDEASKTFEKLAENVAKCFEEMMKQTDAFGTTLKKLASEAGVGSAEMVEGFSKMGETFIRTADGVIKDSELMARGFQNIGEASAKVTGAVSAESGEMAKSISEIGKASGGLKASFSSSTSAVEADMSKMAQSLRETSKVMAETGQTAKQTSDSFSATKLGMDLMIVGEMAKQSGEKITKFFEDAIEDGMDFEKNISFISATLNSKLDPAVKLSTDQIEAMNDKALELGKSGQFSANEIAEGMNVLAQQGLNYEEIMHGAMGSVTDLAVATDSNLAETANVVSDIFHEMKDALKTEFGDTLEEQFTGIANSVNGAMHNARMSMSDFLNTMKYVGPQAGALGLSLKDVSTAIALFAEHGIRGSQAGTTLRRALTNLIPSTDTQIEKMKALGFITKDGTNAFVDQQGKILPLAQIHDVLHEKLEKLTQAQRQQAINMLFGQYAMAGMTIYTEASSEKMQQLSDDLFKNGSAAELAKEKWENTAGRMKEFSAHIATICKQIGADLAPVVDILISKGQHLLEWFDHLNPGVRKTIESVGVLLGVFLTGVGTLGLFGSSMLFLIDGLKGLAPLFSFLSGGLGATMKAFTSFGGIVGRVTTVIGAAVAGGGSFVTILARIATGLLGPVGAAVALGTAFYEMYKHWDAFRNLVDTTIGAIGKSFVGIKEFFFGKDLKEDISTATKDSLTNIERMSQGTVLSLRALKSQSGPLTKELANQVVASSEHMKQECLKHAQDRYNAEVSNAQMLRDKIKGLSQEEYDAIVKNAQKQKEGAVTQAQDLNKKVTEQIEAMKKAGVNVTDDMKKDLLKKFQEQRDGSVAILSDTADQYKVLMGRMKTETGTITAEMASKTIMDANAMRDGQIKAADETRDKAIKAANDLCDKQGLISRAKADELIKQANREHDEVVKQASDMREKVVSQVETMAGENIKSVDTATGKMLTGWQKFQKNALTDYQNFNKQLSDSWDKGWDSLAKGLSDWIGKQKTALVNYWNDTNASTHQRLDGIRDTFRIANDLIHGEFKKAWNDLGIYFKNQLKEMLTIDLSKWNNMGRDMMQNLANGIKSIHIPMPHFSLNPSFSLSGLMAGTSSITEAIRVKWYANGGIMMKPTIFGMNGGMPMGGGEAGPEAILPLSKLPDLLGLDKEKNNLSTHHTKSQINHITVNVNGVGGNAQQLGNDIAKQIRLQMAMVSV